MALLVEERELYHSCRVLFGADIQISREFLEYLQPSGIKSAYRKKAMETHPDMLVGKSEALYRNSTELFRVVHQAYENLTGYLDAREKGFRFSGYTGRYFAQPTTPAATPSSSPMWSASGFKDEAANRTKSKSGYSQRPGDSRQARQNCRQAGSGGTNAFYVGPIPARKLLFGHYLYYCGITNWQTIIKALTWQRTKRPRLGEIARQYGWLTNEDILRILRARRLSDSFGISAVKIGLLNDVQLRILLYRQKKLQKKFGEYFTHNAILTSEQLAQLVSRFYKHNISVAKR